MHFLYILESEVGKHFYIGSSADISKRLNQHNSGYTKSTKRYRPWKIIYTEMHQGKSDACKREWYLKHPAGYLEKRAILEQYSVNKGGVA